MKIDVTMRNTFAVATISFLSGAITTALLRRLREKKRSQNGNEEVTLLKAENENDDLSLFYGDAPTYIPSTIPRERKYLPSELYVNLVHHCIICCTDIVLVRTNPLTKERECLLVERGTEPLKGVWWFPGGRMFKGETFFDAAVRKIREEVGITIPYNNSYDTESKKGLQEDENIILQVLGVYNTFFPTSAWDTDTQKGTQTINAVVLIEIKDNNVNDDKYEVKLDQTSERFKWISVDPVEAEKNGENIYTLINLRRLLEWRKKANNDFPVVVNSY